MSNFSDFSGGGGLEPGDSLVSARALGLPEFILGPGLFLKSDFPLIGDLNLGQVAPTSSTWSSVTSGVSTNLVAVASDEGATWLASSASSDTICRSVNNGLTWSTVITGTGSQSHNAIATDRNGVWCIGVNESIRRSTDNGVNWSSIPVSGAGQFFSIATDTKGVWVAGTTSGNVARSTDNGQTWALVTANLSTNNVVGLATNEGGVWVAGGTTGNASRSFDNGQTFQAFTLDGASGNVSSIATTRLGFWSIFAVERTNLRYLSTDNMQAVQSVSLGGFASRNLSGDSFGNFLSINNAVSTTNFFFNQNFEGGFLSVIDVDVNAATTDKKGVWVAVGSSGNIRRFDGSPPAGSFRVDSTFAGKHLKLFTGETP